MAKLHGNNTGYTNIYFGRRGSGKTQQAVIDAYEAHQRGDIIISNIWLNFPHIRFTNTKGIVPILYEIAGYSHCVSMPILAPTKMLKDYDMVRKSGEIKKFFILWDEIGKHLNARNWQKNFKDDEILLDMLTEPRKYGLTIVGIAQSWKFIDAQFRNITEDWFLFSKTGGWIFERMKCTHLWVHNGEFDYDHPIIIDTKSRWSYFDKMLKFFRTLYWTGEIVGAGKYTGNVPHLFSAGQIYLPPSPSRGILPLINSHSSGKIERVSEIEIEEIIEAPEGPKDNAKRGRPRKKLAKV